MQFTNSQPWIPILMYHSITPDKAASSVSITPEVFEKQLDFLKNKGYTGIRLAELLAALEGRGSLPARPVVLTFDDGYEDNYRYAWPLLEKYGYKACIFLISKAIGKDNSFDRNRPPNAGLVKMLERDHILEMASYGIEFGSHTCTHAVLPGLEKKERDRELKQSRDDLSSLLGHEVNFFAYPHSQVDSESEEAVAEAGYKLAVAGAGPYFQPYRLNRIEPAFANPLKMSLKLSGKIRIVRTSRPYITLRSLIYQVAGH